MEFTGFDHESFLLHKKKKVLALRHLGLKQNHLNFLLVQKNVTENSVKTV